jgi:hypothetical protein
MKKINGFKLANTVLATALMLALSGCGDTAPNDETTTTVTDDSSTSTETTTTPTSSATTPTVAESDVISIYSDAYTDIDVDYITPDWGQDSIATIVEIESGDSAIFMDDLTYQGIDFSSNPQDVSDKEYLHIDYYTGDSTSFVISLISTGPTEETYTLTVPTSNEWTSVDIPLSDFSSVDLTDIIQFKFEGDGDIYVDNLYFHSDDSTDTATTTSSTDYTLYSATDGASVTDVTEPGWGSGSSLVTLDYTDDGTYDHVIEWEMGSDWGGPAAAASFNNLTEDIASYTTLSVKFKYTSTADTGYIEIQMPDASTDQVLVYDTNIGGTWTDLGNDWYQVDVPISSFGTVDDVDQLVLIVKDDASNPVYFTDIVFEGDTDSDDTSDSVSTSTSSVDNALYSATSGAVYTDVTEPGWGSGSELVTLDSTDDATYDYVMEWSMGSGWGAPAVAASINNIGEDLNAYSTFTVKFKYTSTADTGFFEVQMPSASTAQVLVYDTNIGGTWTDLGNDWIQVDIPLSSFGTVDDVDQIVLIVKDDTSNPVYFTDIGFNE